MRLTILRITSCFLFFITSLGLTAQIKQPSIHLLKDLNMFPSSSYGGILAEHNGKVILDINHHKGSRGFWTTDGTEAGTKELGYDLGYFYWAGDHLSHQDNLYHVLSTFEIVGEPDGDMPHQGLWILDNNEDIRHVFSCPESTQKMDNFIGYDNGILFTIDHRTLMHYNDDTGETKEILGEWMGSTAYMTDFILLDNYIIIRTIHDDEEKIFSISRTDFSVQVILSNTSKKFVRYSIVNDQLYFSVRDDSDSGLWITDGTVAGTMKLFSQNLNHDEPYSHAVIGDRFFIKDFDVILETDGTFAGNNVHIDLNTFVTGHVKVMTAFENRIFFSTPYACYAYDGINPLELILDEEVIEFRKWEDKLLILEHQRLHTYSGAEGLKSTAPGWSRGGFRYYKEKVYFFDGDDNTFDNILGTLYALDENSMDVKELVTFEKDSRAFGSATLLESNGLLYFYNFDPENGYELWTSDGTVAGTGIIMDINDGSYGANPIDLLADGDKLYLSLSPDREYNTYTMPVGVYWMDYQTRNLVQIHDEYSLLCNAGEEVILVGDNPHATNGVPGDLVHLDSLDNGFSSTYTVGDICFMHRYQELWRTDGTPIGTFFLADVGVEQQYPRNYHGQHKGIYYFTGVDDDGGNLWRSDGTVAGTYLLKDFDPDDDRKYYFNNFIAHGDTLYFAGLQGGFWKTDGTEAGTLAIGGALLGKHDSNLYVIDRDSLSIFDTETYEVDRIFEADRGIFTSAGNLIYHYEVSTFSDNRLFVSDGTEQGTKVLMMDESLEDFYYHEGRLYFTRDEENTGRELWTSDGTVDGTQLVEDLNPGQGYSYPRFFTVINGDLVFTAYAARLGEELYVIDDFFYPSVQARAFHDENENGIRDVGELLLSGMTMSLSSNGKTAYTNGVGVCGFVTEITMDLMLQAEGQGCWEPIVSSKPVGSAGQVVNFGYRKSPGGELESNMNMVSSVARCNTKGRIWISQNNRGCDAYAGKLEVQLDSLVRLLDSSEPFEMMGDKVVVTFDSLASQTDYEVALTVQFPDETLTGVELDHMVTSHVLLVDGTYQNRDSIYLVQEVRCSYDPNDKQVSPARKEDTGSNYTAFDERLTYTIRFQNTGNDTAYNVLITDQLSSLLDWSTYKPLGSSHEHMINIDDSGLVSFFFENIFLPDSTTNEVLSNGYVSFSMMALNTIEELDTISNTAQIYFDQNAPIITNTITNTFVEFLDFDEDGFLFFEDCDDQNSAIYPGAQEIESNGIDEDCDGTDLSSLHELEGSIIRIYPNPASEWILVNVDGPLDYITRVISLDGKILIQSPDTDQIDISAILEGSYIVELQSVATGQKIVEKITIAR